MWRFLRIFAVILGIILAIPTLLIVALSINKYDFNQNLKVTATFESNEGKREEFFSVINVRMWEAYISAEVPSKESYTDNPIIVPLPGNRSIAFAYEDTEPGSLPRKWIFALASRNRDRKCGVSNADRGLRMPLRCQSDRVPRLSRSTAQEFMDPKDTLDLPTDLYPVILYFSNNDDERSVSLISVESIPEYTNGRYRLVSVSVQPTKASVANSDYYSWFSGKDRNFSTVAWKAIRG